MSESLKLVTRFDKKCDKCEKPILDRMHRISSECHIINLAGSTARDSREEYVFYLCPNCFYRVKNSITEAY